MASNKSTNVFESKVEILTFLSDYFVGNSSSFESNMVGSNFVLVIGKDRFE